MKLNHLSKLLVLLINFTLVILAILPAEAAAPAGIKKLPTLEKFAASVNNQQMGVVAGVYVPGVLALPVKQQPANHPGYVSASNGIATQFQATAKGIIGLLAHNDLAGAQFFDLSAGQVVWIVYGDGALKRYRVTRIHRFQALESKNPYSQLVNLETGVMASSAQVFNQVYTGEDHITFQTCIAKNGDATWGRLFVIATPVS